MPEGQGHCNIHPLEKATKSHVLRILPQLTVTLFFFVVSGHFHPKVLSYGIKGRSYVILQSRREIKGVFHWKG